MNRRAFLWLSAVAAAGFALDQDLSMWVPGRKSYFDMGAARGLSAGDWVTFEAGRDICTFGGDTDPNFTVWLADTRGVRKLDLQSDGRRVGVWDGERVVTYGRVKAKCGAYNPHHGTAYLAYPFVADCGGKVNGAVIA